MRNIFRREGREAQYTVSRMMGIVDWGERSGSRHRHEFRDTQ